MGKYTLTFQPEVEQDGDWNGWGNRSGMHEEGISDFAGCGELAYIIQVWDKEKTWLDVEQENSVIIVGFIFFE